MSPVRSHGTSFHRRRFKAPGGHWLSVLEGGPPEAPAVLLVHGVAGSTANWTYQLAHLATTYRVVVPEMRGHGLTPWPGPSRLADFYEDVEALLIQLDRPTVVVGHSFGGCIATMLAHQQPGRVAGLALINTGGNIPRGFFYRLLWLLCKRADWFRSHYPWMISTSNHVSSFLLSHTLHEWDSWPLYKDLRMPVLVLLGALDVLIPARFGPRLARLMPHSRVRVIPWAGHVLMVERPKLVNAELDAHIAHSLALFEPFQQPGPGHAVARNEEHQQDASPTELEGPDHARESGDVRESQ